MTKKEQSEKIKNIEDKDTKKLDQLEHQIEELNEKLLRAMAESENMRKRYEKQIEEIKEYSISNFAKDLIPALDNLERALQFKPEKPSPELKSILDGVEMTMKELKNVLNKHGISPIEPYMGEKFDYNHHYAISQIESDEHEANSIVGLMQIGYKIKDRLLRPASVSVAKEKEKQ